MYFSVCVYYTIFSVCIIYFNNNICIIYFSVCIVYSNKFKKRTTKTVLNAKKKEEKMATYGLSNGFSRINATKQKNVIRIH